MSAGGPGSGAVGDVRAAVRAGGLLEPGRPIVVMLSGGRDSVCLLDCVVAVAGEVGEASRVGVVSALHVNHGLRGEESDGDERFCVELCGALGVPLEIARSGAPPTTGNLQDWARCERYRAGERAARALGGVLAVAHTATDQAETVIYRLAASPGRRAVTGMRARRGLIVRPLLDAASREQTAAYCRERGLRWRDDTGNDDARYARARVRTRIVPALAGLHPAAVDNVLATARELREEGELLDALAEAELSGDGTIALARLGELPPALGRLVLAAMARRASGPGGAPSTRGRLKDVLALGRRGGERSLDLGGGLRAIARYGVLGVERAGHDTPGLVAAPVALEVPGSVRFGAWDIECGVAAGARGDGRAADAGAGVWVEAEAIAGGAVARPWRHGDRMRPAGLGGSRLLSDLFTDRKVPRSQRRLVPVIAVGEEILWVPGVAVSERCVAGRGAVAISARRRRL